MRLACALLAVILSACGSAPMKMPGAPGRISSAPVAMQEAFASAQRLDTLANRNLAIYSGQTPVVEFGSDRLFVIPVTLDASRRHVIKVRSFIVRTPEGEFRLYYPLLSLIDDGYQVRQTLKPKVEFAFEDNRLTNEFEVGPGVERLLIRTDSEYFRGTFEATTSTSTPNRKSYRYMGMSMGPLSGLLIYLNESKGEVKPFKFGEVGVVTVEAD